MLAHKQLKSNQNNANFLVNVNESVIPIVDFGQASSFEDIFQPIEEVSVPLQNAYRAIKHLSTVKKKTFNDAYEGVRI